MEIPETRQLSRRALTVPKKTACGPQFVIEIRRKKWLDAKCADVLLGYNIALALTDTSFVPRPWEMEEKFDFVTADFAYVRWLGVRKGIKKLTETWDKPRGSPSLIAQSICGIGLICSRRW